MTDYYGEYQQFLDAVGEMADQAVWRTKRHQTYGRGFYAEQVARFKRLDRIQVGHSLTLLLDAAGFEIVKKKVTG